MLATYTLRLKIVGKKDLMKLPALIRKGLHEGIREAMEFILRPNVIKFCPTQQEEKDTLVKGQITQSVPGGRTGPAGDASAGRFIKNPEFLYLRDAIMMEPVFMAGAMGFFIRRDYVSQKIGFAWMKQIGPYSLTRRSTMDPGFSTPWKNLLNTWEVGGSYPVRGRAGGLLSPEKGVFAKEMVKTIPPKHMFLNAWNASIAPMRQYIYNKVSTYARTL
ncbi:hypothetical protein LCGC14_2195520 [marine sediment metagenome]|uniref:Uncharacterized protein n=1 Tax=marine sediment metagenome TaxID=412755 RepID=A0A0F9E5D8_9ZZZZ|nr:hypothetical protein [bacterium]